MKIATWNVNGIRARHENLIRWLNENPCDIICLQETKTIDEQFPFRKIEEMGYYISKYGQKGFNGVAILSKLRFEEENRISERFIEGVFSTKQGVLRVVSLYAPNGNPLFNTRNITSDKFSQKLAWMVFLHGWIEKKLALEEFLILAGDYNVIPEEKDAKNPENWINDALFQPEIQKSFRKLKARGLVDAVRCTTDSDDVYTFWDYQAGAWKRNNGIRIDHILLSSEAADYLKSTSIEKHMRNWEKPSDHVPVIIELALDPA